MHIKELLDNGKKKANQLHKVISNRNQCCQILYKYFQNLVRIFQNLLRNFRILTVTT